MRSRGDDPGSLLTRTMRLEARRVIGWASVCLMLAVLVQSRWLAGFDAMLTEWAQAHRASNGDGVARTLTFFGSSTWALAAGVMMTAWWARARQGRMIAVFWLSWGLGLAVQSVLRCGVAQWRPDAPLPASIHSMVDRLFSTGFTSGHAFRSAFVFGWWANVLTQRRTSWRRIGAVACVALIILVGWTRVYLWRHWMSDVVGGWVIAAWSLAVAARLGAWGESSPARGRGL